MGGKLPPRCIPGSVPTRDKNSKGVPRWCTRLKMVTNSSRPTDRTQHRATLLMRPTTLPLCQTGNATCLHLSYADFAYGTHWVRTILIVPHVLIISPHTHARLNVVIAGLSGIPIDVGHGWLLQSYSPDKLGLGRRIHTLSGSPEAGCDITHIQNASILRFLWKQNIYSF